MKIRIYYEDTDCGGVVYYANYLKYLERARTEFFEDKGIDIAALQSQGILFVVAQASLDYKSPAFYADILDIQTELIETSTVRFKLSYTVKNDKTDQILVKAFTTMACVNKDLKPTRLPQDVKAKLI